MSGILYIIGTPIGNLEDMTLRQLRILQEEIDFLAAEDTRVTQKLLNHFDIHVPTISYHEHSPELVIQKIMSRLHDGQSGGIVTDAGMPCISDPGVPLVQRCCQEGIPVQVVPGPSAVVSALAVSAQETRRFVFDGFLPVQNKERQIVLRQLAQEFRTIVLYEAPHKLLRTLRDLADTLGPQRMLSVCRELTKLHEQVLRCSLAEAIAHFEQNEPRGEFVLVLAPDANAAKSEEYSLEDAVALAQQLVEQGLKPRAACKQAAESSGLRSNEIYQALSEQRD